MSKAESLVGIDPLKGVGEALKWVGLHEEDDRDRLMKNLLQPAGIRIDPSRTPWCAYFVNAILSAVGLEGTGTGLARDFQDWGVEASEKEPGSIVVYRSHVGFVTEDGKVCGGNQSDGVNVGDIEWYGKPIAYRKSV